MKKIISSFLLTIMLFSISTTEAFAAESSVDKQLDFSNGKEVISRNIQDFNENLAEEYLDYDFVGVEYHELKYLDIEKIHELMDNGTVLCVKGSNSIADIYKELSIDQVPQNITLTGANVLGTFIYNQNNNYVYGLMSEAEVAEVKKFNDVKNATSSNTRKTDIAIKINNVDVNEFSKAIYNFRKNYNKQAYKPINESEVYFQLPDKSFNGTPYTSFTNIVSGDVTIGSLAIAQYRYDICFYQEGGINKVITDIVSQMTISAASNVYVNNYSTRMHANISNMTIIGQSYLNSNSSSSYTLSGNIGFSGDTITGSLGASTTNNYTTNNQNITNDFLVEKYKNWICDPTVNWKSASWEIEPAIRIKNNNASQWQTGAFSSFRAARWDKGDFWGTYYTLTNPVEVGGWW